MDICKAVVRVFILMVIITMLVPLFVYMILYAGSTTRLEWIDQDGRGNGSCHKLIDSNGKHSMSFRLSDYGNTNNVYQLLIFSESNVDFLDRNMVDISIQRVSQYGELQAPYTFTGLFGDIVNGFYLPNSCSPQSQGEKLVIKVVMHQSKHIGSSHMPSPRRKIVMEARLICEKVRHFPSV